MQENAGEESKLQGNFASNRDGEEYGDWLREHPLTPTW